MQFKDFERINSKIKGSDLFIHSLPTAFDDTVGSFCLQF